MNAVAEAGIALAPDPRLPQRDALLDPALVGERLAALLGRERGLEVRRCERVRAKYQPGRSLRVLHRIEVDGRCYPVAARTFSPERSETVYRRAVAGAVPTGPLRPVAHDRELATVFWTFPNDRKLANLPALAQPPARLERALSTRWTEIQLTAYAPEKSATVRCLAAGGSALAFAKVYAGDEGERTHRTHAALAAAGPQASRRVARSLGYSREYRTLFVEPIAGRPIAELDGVELEPALADFGAALASVHRRPAPRGVPDWERLRPERLAAAAALIGRARPDVATRALALAAALASSFEERVQPACLHGDAHPKNGIMGGAGVVLIDLDQVCRGPAAADLGGLLAGLAYQRCLGELSEATARRLGEAVLGGYAEAATCPPHHSLRWHLAAALLVERALRSVHRVREPGLANLDAILDAAEESCP